MRTRTIFLIGMSMFLLLPHANALAEPVLVWPQSDLLNREAAANLTSWFTDQLGAQVDTSKDPEWLVVNETGLPDFLLAVEAYVLPLVDGKVEARYVEAGILRDIELQGNTSYFAQSTLEDDLIDVASTIATDLGLTDIQPILHVEYAMSYAGTPEEELQGLVLLEDQTDLGTSYRFNWLSVTVREADLRVVAVGVYVWYQVVEDPDVTFYDAVAMALELAELEHNATDPLGTASGVTVRNGTSFVYLVDVDWRVENGTAWTLDVWVDATTGDILFEDGPRIASGDLGGGDAGLLLFNMPWIPIALLITIVLAVGLAVFYRLSAERALDHFTRGRIYGYIQANPGITYSKVRETLDLKNGTLAYHLWVLERLAFIRSVRKGRLRQLYLRGSPVSKGSLVLSRLQYAILDLLKAEGPMTQTEMAKHFKISRQRAHYNVKVLRSMSLLAIENGGKVELLREGLDAIEELGGGS
ncbi:MAG: helix-turn-helix domain-containing protein [Thermoplasmata archaeon]